MKTFLDLVIKASFVLSSLISSNFINAAEYDVPNNFYDFHSLYTGGYHWIGTLVLEDLGDGHVDCRRAVFYHQHRESESYKGPYGGELDIVEGSSQIFTLTELNITQEVLNKIEGEAIYPASMWEYRPADHNVQVQYYNASTTSFDCNLFGEEGAVILRSRHIGIPDYGLKSSNSDAYRKTQMFRFHRPDNDAYFFTASKIEKQNVLENLANVYEYEGVSHNVVSNYTKNARPVYRLYNALSGAHFYSANEREVTNVLTNAWEVFSIEGVAFYVFLSPETGTMPVYRFYSPQTGSHFFTISESEKNILRTSVSEDVLKYDGIAWYAYP